MKLSWLGNILKGPKLANDRQSLGRRGRQEGTDEVCPVTIADELLAMQIDWQGGGKELRLGDRKKNFKETFTPLSPTYCYKAKKLESSDDSPAFRASPRALMSCFVSLKLAKNGTGINIFTHADSLCDCMWSQIIWQLFFNYLFADSVSTCLFFHVNDSRSLLKKVIKAGVGWFHWMEGELLCHLCVIFRRSCQEEEEKRQPSRKFPRKLSQEP